MTTLAASSAFQSNISKNPNQAVSLIDLLSAVVLFQESIRIRRKGTVALQATEELRHTSFLDIIFARQWRSACRDASYLNN